MNENVKPPTAGKATEKTLPKLNLNWLIHIFYARQEYRPCKELILLQLNRNNNNNNEGEEFDKRELNASESDNHADGEQEEYLYYIKGLIAKDEKDYQEALKCLQKSIDINPNNPETYREMGKTMYALGRWKQSLEIFLKAESLLKRCDSEIYHYIGDLIIRNNNNNNNNAGAGAASIKQDRINEAKEYFHRAVQNGRRIDSYQKLSEIYRSENNYPKAIEMLESSLQIDPKNVNNLSDIGILYLKVNDTKSAFDKLLDVTKLNDRSCSKAYIALGAILQSKNDVDGALNKYKYIEKDIQNGAEIWSNIGLCFFRKKKFIAAIACLKKSLWISPLNFNCLYNMGLIYLSAKQYASAFQSFAVAITLRPESAECFMMFGICLKWLNDPTNALVAFERSVLLSDAIKNPLIYLNYAIFCWQCPDKLEMAQLYLGNFLKMSEHMNIRLDYIKIGDKLKEILPPFEMIENVVAIEENQNEIIAIADITSAASAAADDDDDAAATADNAIIDDVNTKNTAEQNQNIDDDDDGQVKNDQLNNNDDQNGKGSIKGSMKNKKGSSVLDDEIRIDPNND